MNLFLLDVDGVVNAVPIWGPREPQKCPWPNGWETCVANFHGEAFNITFARDLTNALLDIHQSGLAEVRWLTTWENQANVHLAEHFGFPHFKVVGAPTYGDGGWWKFPLAKSLAETCKGTVVWADDDLRHDEPARTWATEADNVLTLIPHPRAGLTPDDIETARRLLAG